MAGPPIVVQNHRCARDELRPKVLECRSLRHSILHGGCWTNPWALAGIAGVRALQVTYIYAPPMHDVFGSAPLSAEEWLLALAAAATVLPVVGIEKWGRRRDRSFPHRKPGVSPMTGRAVGGTIEDNVS